jgi:hypothetical protein
MCFLWVWETFKSAVVEMTGNVRINLILWCFSVTTVAVEKQQVLHILNGHTFSYQLPSIKSACALL